MNIGHMQLLTSTFQYRSEATSVSGTKRKNANRIIGSVAAMERKKMGYRCDFIFRETVASHDDRLEYGAGEVGINYTKIGTESMTEGSVKLPKVLKDMLDDLIIRNGDFKGLQTSGILYSGLIMQLITAYRPHRYVTRITRGKELRIPSSVEKFGAEVLLVLVQVWQVSYTSLYS